MIPLGFLAKDLALGFGADEAGACFEGEERPAFPVHRGPRCIFTGEDCVPDEPTEEAVEAAAGKLLAMLGLKETEDFRTCALCFAEGQADALVELFFSFMVKGKKNTHVMRLTIGCFIAELRALLTDKFGGGYLEVSDYCEEEILWQANIATPDKVWFTFLGKALWGKKLFANKLKNKFFPRSSVK